MIKKTIGSWQIEYDREATKAAFVKLPNGTGCNCHTCRNFEKAVSSLSSTVFSFFGELGIDLSKPSEVYEINYEDGTVHYGGFYHIVGNYLLGDDAWQSVSKDTSCQKLQNMFSVEAGFVIGFTRFVAVVPEGFPEPILQMEVGFSLPWVLDEPFNDNQ